jgi:hypothetical protein
MMSSTQLTTILWAYLLVHSHLHTEEDLYLSSFK